MRNLSAALLCAVFSLLSGPSPAAELRGSTAPLGEGTVETFAVLNAGGVPQQIGVILSNGALDRLPTEPNTELRCFDLDGSGSIDGSTECEGDYELRLPFPDALTDRTDIPFDWAMVNWNPRGHPPSAWSVAHFDIHFYQIPEAEVDAIRLGNCGIFIDCEDFLRAVKPVPEKYINADHVSVEAAVGGMGNHLIDAKTPELGVPPKPFTHTWIYGAYDGRIIFHEVMAAHSFLALGPDICRQIKQPAAWQKAGYYPTQYCFRRETDGALKVFMDAFVKRNAG